MALVKVKPWGKGQGEYVLVDESELTSDHKLYSPEPEPMPEKQGKKDKKAKAPE